MQIFLIDESLILKKSMQYNTLMFPVDKKLIRHSAKYLLVYTINDLLKHNGLLN